MNFSLFITKYHYNNLPYLVRILFFPFGMLLFFVSLIYLLAINIKNFLYEIKILKEKEVSPFVICVGNLTTGGVGKTPLVCEIANYCTSVLKKKTAVISRGYKSNLDNKNVNVIKEGTKLNFDNAELCGDEPYLIAQNTKHAFVLTCSNRHKAIEFAKEKYGVEIVIFDDGFTNRKIKKDYNILALDLKRKHGNTALLPCGPLREPQSEYKRAQYVVCINKEYDTKQALAEYDKVKKMFKNKRSLLLNFVPKKYINIKNNLEIIPNCETALAFCAIGNPDSFYQYVQKDFNLISTKSFDDHHGYDFNDIENLVSLAKKHSVQYLITTKKDEVKIKDKISQIDFPFLTLEIQPDYNDDRMFYDLKEKIEAYEAK